MIIKSIKSSLTKKLITSYIFIILIPVIIGAISYINITQSKIKNDLSNVIENQLKKADADITEKVNLCRQNADLFARDQEFLNFIMDEEGDDLWHIETIQAKIIPKIQIIKLSNSYISNLLIIHGNPKIPYVYDGLYYDSTYQNGKWQYAPQSINESVKINYADMFIERSSKMEFEAGELSQPNTTMFTLYRPIYSLIMNYVYGIEVISIKNTAFINPLKQIQFSGQEKIVLVYKNGEILYNSSKEFKPLKFNEGQDYEQTVSQVVNGEEMRIASRYIKSIDSRVFIYMPASMFEINNSYMFLILVVILLGILMFFIVAIFLSKLMTNQLVKLSSAINKIKKGKLDTRVKIKSTDEIGLLAENFNEMLDKINKLIRNLNKANKAEKEALYKALENQMNPHFLCNALEMIRMTAEVHNDPQISSMAELMARYFMYNIKWKDKYVDLKSEIKNVTEYLEIIKVMKNNEVNFTIDIHDELSGRLEEFFVLKFILQPIVENSIKYGFKDKVKDCRIHISIKYQENSILIAVEDNGVGISRERVNELKQHFDIHNENVGFRASGNGIGLRNINERIKLNFGEHYGVSLDSMEKVGTEVRLLIPIIRDLKEVEVLYQNKESEAWQEY